MTGDNANRSGVGEDNVNPNVNCLDGKQCPNCLSFGPAVPSGQFRKLIFGGQLTTTVEQLAYAFLSPGNLPPEGSYAKAIRAKIKALGV